MKKQTKVLLLVIVAILISLFFYNEDISFLKSRTSSLRACEISQKLGYFRGGFEVILREKRLDHVFTPKSPKEGELYEEIISLDELLQFPNDKDVIVHIYSKGGVAKSIRDKNVSSIVVSSDTGWTLATINFLGGENEK